MTKLLFIYCSIICVCKPNLLHLHQRWDLLDDCRGMGADDMHFCSGLPRAILSTVILLCQVWAGPADDAVKMNASSEMEVLYPSSLLIQFTRRRQEYVALVTKEKELRKIHFITSRLLYFLLFSFFSSPQVIFVPRLLVPSCIWRDNDDYGDHVGDAEGVKWCHML